MTQTLTIRRPDDWHLHLRDGAMLRAVLPETTRHFARAIIMPNLVPPVVTGAQAAAYRDRILSALPDGADFAPLMTLYLTEDTDPDDVAAAHASRTCDGGQALPRRGHDQLGQRCHGFRQGARRAWSAWPRSACRFAFMARSPNAEIDIFDREAVFIDRVLDPIRRAHAGPARTVMEHITTRDGVDYAKTQDNLGATITTHHLVINRNHILAGGIRPHYYCLPVAKREEHRLALRAAATSGDPRFFLGTDSAPHTDALKENACGCAGCFTATNTMSILAHVFEEEARIGAA